MDRDAMWRFVREEGRRMEAFSEDLQVVAMQGDVSALRRKLSEMHDDMRQLDALYAALSL